MHRYRLLLLVVLFCAKSPTGFAQIADLYPHDDGIENDPDVLYVEKFEDGMPNVLSRYQDKKNIQGMALVADVPPGSNGAYALKMTNLGGANSGGHLFREFTPGWDSTLYLRYYVKYPAISQGYLHHESIWFGGYNPATPWPNPQAGICGLGDKRISIAYEPVGQTAMNTYLYWGDMHSDPNGDCWGNVMVKGEWQAPSVPFDDWLCVEIMVKLNNPVTAANGELRIWQNGTEVGYWGPGFPNGAWTWDKFIVNATAQPFPGFRWRTDPGLNFNYLWIEYYDDQSPAGVSHYILYDHIVVAKKRIGPIYDPANSAIQAQAPLNLKLYPNPATDELQLENAAELTGKPFRVFNCLGNAVLYSKIASPNTALDVSALPQGIYFLKIPESTAPVLKFIKR